MSANDEDALKEIRRLSDAGHKIDAIKLIREHFKVSLGDATSIFRWVEKGDPTVPMPGTSGTSKGFPKMGASRGIGKSPLLPLAIFIIVGCILLGVAGWLASRTMSLRKNGQRVEAVVVENIRYGRRTFMPVFEYTWKGDVRRVDSGVGSSINGRPVHETGEKVMLWVDPKDPERFGTDSWFDAWFTPTILGGIGSVFILIGGGVCLLFRGRI